MEIFSNCHVQGLLSPSVDCGNDSWPIPSLRMGVTDKILIHEIRHHSEVVTREISMALKAASEAINAHDNLMGPCCS